MLLITLRLDQSRGPYCYPASFCYPQVPGSLPPTNPWNMQSPPPLHFAPLPPLNLNLTLPPLPPLEVKALKSTIQSSADSNAADQKQSLPPLSELSKNTHRFFSAQSTDASKKQAETKLEGKTEKKESNSPCSDIPTKSKNSDPPLGLVLDTLEKAELIPPSLGTVASAFSAAQTVHELQKNIQKDLEKGVPIQEAVVCQTAKTVTQETLKTVGTGALVGGLPIYLSEVAAFPPLGITFPAVVTGLPMAYKGVEALSEKVGQTVEKSCHEGFAEARKLSQGGKL